MRAPVLESLSSQVLPPEVEGAELFRVVEGGEFAGRAWVAGEIMMCRGEPRSGDAVVLVARGRQGRPRVGQVVGTRFLGEVGEPCHPARWRASAKVVAAWSPRGERWVVERVSGVASPMGVGSVMGAQVVNMGGLAAGSDGCSGYSAVGEGPCDSGASSVFAADPNQLSLFAA